jgi:hypothetical protein
MLPKVLWKICLDYINQFEFSQDWLSTLSVSMKNLLLKYQIDLYICSDFDYNLNLIHICRISGISDISIDVDNFYYDKNTDKIVYSPFYCSMNNKKIATIDEYPWLTDEKRYSIIKERLKVYNYTFIKSFHLDKEILDKKNLIDYLFYLFP